ncbi:HAD-IIB family hydrolase [Magnetococcus sp. PR-3]|uniref:HAD-IIB family hydrolase n=1 Tax=Magnetococcus sp. PR-3 TaxID=3120355 RepID=UPI002FCE43D6
MATQSTYLLCTDLDRTLLPNGDVQEQHGARQRFSALAAHPSITLAYVSGRDRSRIEEAIKRYHLPMPNYAVADVGTSIYTIEHSEWQPLQSWNTVLASTWTLDVRRQIPERLTDLPILAQTGDRQGRFKQSYTSDPNLDKTPLIEEIEKRLQGLPIEQVWSRDDVTGERLLDILPAGIDKLAAVRMLQQQCQVEDNHTFFAGDSGNDLAVLTSSVPSVLVGNAEEQVQAQARKLAQQAGHLQSLHMAQAYYADGILEGFQTFFTLSNNE